jgi:hypothetical protein
MREQVTTNRDAGMFRPDRSVSTSLQHVTESAALPDDIDMSTQPSNTPIDIGMLTNVERRATA